MYIVWVNNEIYSTCRTLDDAEEEARFAVASEPVVAIITYEQRGLSSYVRTYGGGHVRYLGWDVSGRHVDRACRSCFACEQNCD